MADPALSLILPCRNQADHIGAILPKYLPPLERTGLPFELVVVPNACTDDTVESVARLAQQDSRIRMLVMSDGGWGRAVRAGLNAAWGSILVYTNTARTDPDILTCFIQRFLQSGECLLKARRELRQAPLREFGSFLFNLEARLCLGVRCHDINGAPKVFSRQLYESLMLTSTGDLLDLELVGAVTQRNVPIIEIPVQGFRRHGGKSSTTLASAWKMYSGALDMTFQRLRIRKPQTAVRP